ncbi:uncharacterized protein LOC6585865 [Drosophila mojavensis]|uniref:uncharacterized protein LOC6585865 n=1 Tax=Drosophila mojavensis TaxID=7230 RepID=UPI001CD186FC|nr:uncharacterized protein LOC6585865 [Drosophila mojavensis]
MMDTNPIYPSHFVREYWGHTMGIEGLGPTGLQLNLGYPGIGIFLNCPLCDSSVYSYCSSKVEHDACCCIIPGHQLHPTQCAIYNCSLLYAKSCYEHALIKNCCCENRY